MTQKSILFALFAQATATEPASEGLEHVSLLQTKAETRSRRALASEAAEQASEESVETQSLNEWMSVQQLVNLVKEVSDSQKDSEPKKMSVQESYAIKGESDDGPTVDRFTRTVEMDPAKLALQPDVRGDLGLLQSDSADASDHHPHSKSSRINSDVDEAFTKALDDERKKDKDSEASERGARHAIKWKAEWPSLTAKKERSKVSNEDMYKRLDGLIKHAKTVRDAFKVLAKVGEGMPAIGFVKTHRTGSSTVASILHRIGDDKSSLFLLPGGSQNGLGWPAAFPGEGADAANHQFDIICNNAVFNKEAMDAFLKPAPLYFSVLRKPVAQVISAFEFFAPPAGPNWEARVNWMQKIRTNPNDPALGKRGPSLVAQFRNSQATDLGWYELWDGKGIYDHDDGKIDAWLAKLEDQLGFVMLTEYFDEGLVLLRRKLDLDIQDMVYYKMKQSPNKLQAPNAKEMARMREYNHVDVKLYEHFNQTFFDAWEKAGGYSALNSELEELRARNEALEKSCNNKEDEDGCPWSFHTDSVEYTEYLRKKQLDLLLKKGDM